MFSSCYLRHAAASDIGAITRYCLCRYAAAAADIMLITIFTLLFRVAHHYQSYRQEYYGIRHTEYVITITSIETPPS